MPHAVLDTAKSGACPPAPNTLRLSRWLVFASVPLLLTSLLFFCVQNTPTVQADAEHTVGACPEPGAYTTIQDAVNAAAPGDIINICPGIYPESVNLSWMQPNGDITLRKAPGTSGDVTIAPLSGPGIWISATEDFTGSVTLQDLHIQSDDRDGIAFYPRVITGSVTLNNIFANDNFGFGALINAEQDVLVTGSEFSSNGATGLRIRGGQNISVLDTLANNNGLTLGVGFEANGIDIVDDNLIALCDVGAAVAPYHVLVGTTSANENRGYGIRVYATSDVTLDNTDVISNGYDGANVFAAGGECEPPANITLFDSRAEYNGWANLQFLGEIDASSFYEFGGFRLTAFGNVTVAEDSQANENASFGFCLAAEGNSHVSDSRAEANADEGFIYSFACRFFGFGVSDEQSAGAQGDILEAQSHIQTSVVFSDSSAVGNGSTGFSILESFQPVTLTQISATGNMTGVAFNEDPIIFLGGAGSSSSEEISAEICECPADGATHIDNSLIQSNTAHGVYYGQGIVYPTAPMDSVFPLDLGASVAAIEPITSTNTVASSIICQNGIGLEAEQYAIYLPFPFPTEVVPHVLQVDARGNWWGQPSGPSGIGPGTGDSIQSSTLNPPTDTVEVLYAPWINGVYGTVAPNLTLAGLPVNFTYQFHDGVPGYYLENGVGDPNNGPLFALSTNNGVINGPEPVNRFIVNRSISGSATPATPGAMGVRLTGPCNLTLELPVTVASPSIAIAKSPDEQAILSGSSASFNITIINNGNISLTDILVEDANASLCAKPVGSVGVLAPAGTANYTCQLDNVTQSFVNTAIARGTPLVAGVPAGAQVSASDSANVFVAEPSIAVFKSPDAQGVPTGGTATFSLTVRNTGNIALTDIRVDDTAAPNCQRVANSLGNLDPGQQVTYECTHSNVTTNITNTAQAFGTALIAGNPTGSPVSASDTARVFVSSIKLVKTAFVAGFFEKTGETFNPSDCALKAAITVPAGTTVKYCYTVTNTGNYTLSVHSLVDSHISGPILNNFAFVLPPGNSFSTVDAGVKVTSTLTLSTTNVATWTAQIAAPVVSIASIDATNATVAVSTNAQATVTISSPNQDQDGDGIPDNEEGSTDSNSNGIPDFLDPLGPTGEQPGQQPGLLDLFMPVVGNNQ